MRTPVQVAGTLRRACCTITFFCSAVFLSGTLVPLQAAITAQLTPSVPSPSPIGTVVTWTVQASDSNAGQLWYRFRSAPLAGNFELIRDFGPLKQLDWTTIDRDGVYVIEAVIRNQTTGETIYTSAAYEMDSRVTGRHAVVNPTANPLVFLYSAPACPNGGVMYASFWSSNGLSVNSPASMLTVQMKPCDPMSSMNFYLAGLYANSTYQVAYSVFQGGRWTAGPTLSLSTGNIPQNMTVSSSSNQTVQRFPTWWDDSILLQGPLNSKPFATDLRGNVVWYYPQTLTFLTHPERGGRFFGIANSGTDPSGSVLREFDVAGTTIKETNAATINAQLVALGKRPIGVFHHEARSLSNGNIVTLGTVEQILTDVQGPGPIDVIGDMIIVLDSNLRVLWTWDTFDYLDVTRKAVLGETCSNGGACQSHFLARDGNDWTHGNSVGETPDGNLVFSARHLDWVIKVNYDQGRGDGRVLWKLGKDGDFIIQSDDSFPWFSHQHDANVLTDNMTMTLFDNGNTRKVSDPQANSRGQVLLIDEQNFTVSHILNADLGVFSPAVGSAQRLANGDYHFDAGFVDNNSAISFEVYPTGKAVSSIRANALEYRTFRLSDLYRGMQPGLPLDESQRLFSIDGGGGFRRSSQFRQ